MQSANPANPDDEVAVAESAAVEAVVALPEPVLLLPDRTMNPLHAVAVRVYACLYFAYVLAVETVAFEPVEPAVAASSGTCP